MLDANKFLLEWAITFLKNRDIVKKDIIGIEDGKDKPGFIVQYKDKKRVFILMTYLEKSVFDGISNNENFCILTLNNKANVEFVISNWKDFINFNSLAIYFLNPFSKLEKLWIINPYVHDSVCDKSSLRTGIKSMFENVEEIDERSLEINLISR